MADVNCGVDVIIEQLESLERELEREEVENTRREKQEEEEQGGDEEQVERGEDGVAGAGGRKEGKGHDSCQCGVHSTMWS